MTLLSGPAIAAESASTPPNPSVVLATMERVADWQIAHPDVQQPTDGWVQAAGATGFMALADIDSSPRFAEAMEKMGEKNGWKPGPRLYHADDHCIIQTYAELYLRYRNPAMIAPSVERFDYILAHPPTGSLKFSEKAQEQWAWCDALFMGPPAWVRLWAATGKQAYLDYALNGWRKTSDFLYDPEEHLFFRDSNYFTKREANGKKIFWSRGNGWVIGGLVRIMEFLPANHPARPQFERQFKEMMAKLVTLQQPDGFWRSSLLDPENYPAKEESGTGFYCYGLAWGLNHGLLDRETFEPAALRAWAALNSCVQPDGRLIHVQPIGADPKKFDPNSTEPYGVGSFLLAGSEMFRLAGGKPTPSK